MESPYGININSEMGDDSKNSGNLLIRENIASDDIDNTYLQYILEIPLQLNDELEDNEGLKEFQSLFYWKCFCNPLRIDNALPVQPGFQSLFYWKCFCNFGEN